MRVYSSSTKASHPIHFSGHFNRLPDNGKLDREILIGESGGKNCGRKDGLSTKANCGSSSVPENYNLLSNILGIRDVGAQSLGSALFHEARTCHWKELAILHAVGKPAPQDPF